MFIASDLRHRIPFLGQVVVGLFIAFPTVLVLAIVYWAVRAAGRFAAYKIRKVPLELPSFALPGSLMDVEGGIMSFIPSFAIWIWGQFYLFWGPEASVSWTVFAAQAVWLLLANCAEAFPIYGGDGTKS